MEIKDLSVIITTFKSENIIKNCLESLPKNIRILIIENSNNYDFKEKIESKYPNVECYLTGDNKGYSAANNIGLSKVKTKYALVLNPDTVVEKNTIKNFLKTADSYSDFWLMGPINNQSGQNNFKGQEVIEVDNLKGFAIFFNMKKFNNDFFDENYFLYFEEIDLCRKVKKNKGIILLNYKIIVNHSGGLSVNQNFREELEKNRNLHWMWSSFYFHKKHKGFIIALIIIFPKLFSSLLKTIFYQLILDKKKRDIYFCRLSGIINSILGKKSWYRPTLD